MSWSQLQAILRESREEAAQQRQQLPVACPNDGEPLVYNERRRIWACPFDGYQVAGGPKEQ